MITSTSVRRAALIAALVAVPGLHAAEVAGVGWPTASRSATANWCSTAPACAASCSSRLCRCAVCGQKAATPAAIYDSATPRRMVLRLLRDLDADSLHSALDEGLRNNHSPAELSDMQAQADQLAGIMKAIGKVREGIPSASTSPAKASQVSQNGEVRGKVAGAGFAKALLKVWLGDKPADASPEEGTARQLRPAIQEETKWKNLAQELPSGVPAEIDIDHIPSLVALFERPARPSPTRWLTSAWGANHLPPARCQATEFAGWLQAKG